MNAPEISPGLRERIEQAFQTVPFAQFLGIEIVEIEPGEAILRLHIRPELLRNKGIVHGGVTASLIDTASAFAILTLIEPGQTTTTVDLTIHYLRPLSSGSMTAKATVLRAGKRVIVASVEVFDSAGKLAATAVTTYLRMT